MIRFALIDDNEDFLNYMSESINNILVNKKIDPQINTFTDGEQMLKDLLEGEKYYDVVFLDVQMPNQMGTEIAKAIRSKFNEIVIVFVSSYDTYVFEAFDYDTMAYIRKSEFDKKIENTIERIITKVNKINKEFIFNNSEGKYVVSAQDIMYFESLNHCIQIYKVNGEVIKITNSLNQLEQRFSIYNFIRIHAGYLINLKYVYSIENTSVILINNKALPISRHRLKEVKKAFQTNLRGV